ncbi:alpha/beta-hydrolase [Backusella circina FSU 941]|nr:alpha/beta-hydrolase [Backusella circina FSU 941]
MDDIRKMIKKTSPPAVTLQTLRTTLTLPPAAARTIINDLSKPLHDQKRFVKKFDNEHWKGSLIMSEMIRCDDAVAIERLKRSDIVIFEVHGGGFRVGNSLAPKHKYPIPLNETLKAYQYLTQDLGVSPNRVIFSGDSAGGALCLETLMRTYTPNIIHDLDAPRENMDPIPAGILLTSPLVTAETSSESWKKFAKSDMVSPALVKLVLKEFLGLPERDEKELPILRLSHIRSKFERFLPKNVMVFVGSKEVMRDDILELANSVKEDGASNITVYEENYAHDWFLIHEIVKKKDKMMLKRYDELFVDFVVKSVREALATSSSAVNLSVQDIKLPPIATTMTNEEQNSDADTFEEKDQGVITKEDVSRDIPIVTTKSEDVTIETISIDSDKVKDGVPQKVSKENDTVLSAYQITSV